MAGLKPDTSPRRATPRCSGSGSRRIDLYYQHKDDESVPLADSLGAIDALVKAGKMRAIGLSQFTPARLDEAMRDAAEQRPRTAERAADLVQYGRARQARGAAARPAAAHGLARPALYASPTAS